MEKRVVAWWVTALCALAACGDTDAGSDAGAGGGDADASAAPPYAVRAWRLTAGELPDDPRGLATWAEGDIALANERIAVIVEDVGASDLYDPWGGKLVGITRVDGGRLVEAANFNELIHGVGRYIPEVAEVEIVDDGSDGERALVRARGTLVTLPFIDDFAKGLFPIDHTMDVELEFELAARSDFVDVHMTFDNAGGESILIRDLSTLIFQRERMQPFAPSYAFAVPDSGTVDWLGFVDDTGTSYAFSSPHGGLSIPLPAQSGFDLAFSPDATLEADAPTRLHIARIFVGGPGLDGLAQALARSEDRSLREVSGVVRDAGGATIEGARVHALSADGEYLTRARTDSEGRFAVHVPDGAIELVAYERGYSEARQSVAADASGADLVLKAGMLRVTIRDKGSDAQLPARVQVWPLDAFEEPAPELGEASPGEDRLHLAFPIEGEVVLPVPAGRHRVVVSRGYEYDIHEEEVTAEVGAEVTVAARLARVVDTSGVLCADTHVHTWRSPDAGDTPALKIASAAGEGLEIVFRTEHEWVSDHAETIAELGVENHVFSLPGEELTTFVWGHLNVFPLDPMPGTRNAGAIPWEGDLAPAVFERILSRSEAPAFTVNHPRSVHPLLGAREGYFEAAGYDPATGVAEDTALWSEDFSVIEAFNGETFASQLDGTVTDWFSFLNRGKKLFVVGSSDSHHVRVDPVGYPRTCLFLGTDDPQTLSADAVRDAVVAGHSFVSGGIYIDATVMGATPVASPFGETVRGVGATASIRVRVQAPTWIDATKLEVYVDGALQSETTLGAGAEALRFDDVIDVPVASAGSWVVFHASGDAELAPVHAGREPFAVTNPIFLER